MTPLFLEWTLASACLVKGKQAKMKGANNLTTSEIVGGFRGDSIAYRVAPRRGVFALKYFSRGDTVEICPVVTLARGDPHPTPTIVTPFNRTCHLAILLE
jgi:hypothetical protein